MQGGPGASGTEEIARIGRDLSSIVGGQFDLVSWDPRGVNLTSPRLDCFPSEATAHNFQREQEAVGLRYEAHPLADLAQQLPSSAKGGGPVTKGEMAWAARLDAFARAADRACGESGTRSVLEGSSTAMAARDLKMMAEAMGERDGVRFWSVALPARLTSRSRRPASPPKCGAPCASQTSQACCTGRPC